MTQVETPMALKGLRILDIATYVAGPYSATLLADFGADVIKVELPRVGDHLRRTGPIHQDVSLWWANDNRNKKAITVDMRRPKGQEVIKRLVAISDVVIENYRSGTLERWNLGYDELKRVNPRIILLRVTGFGQSGPYRRRAGFAAVGEALGGLRHLVGYPDGPPLRAGIAIGDYLTALFGALAIMIAVHYRDRSGQGQWIDNSIYESVFRIMDYLPLEYSTTGTVRQRTGEKGYGAVGIVFRTKDERWLQIVAGADHLFVRLTRAMRREELAEDARFQTIAARTDHADELNAIVQEWVGQRTSAEAVSALDEAEVPVAPVHSIADIFADPHFQARGNLVELEDPLLGRSVTQSPVPKFSLTPGQVRHLAPTLGEHNVEILAGLLGYNAEELSQLQEEGVI